MQSEYAKKPNGFTLYELLTVMAIIAVVAAISVPSVVHWLAGVRLNSAVRVLQQDLEAAKMRAIRENAFVAVTYDANGYKTFLDNGSKAGNWSREADEPLLADRRLGGGVVFDLGKSTFRRNRFRFNSRGRSAMGTVALTNPTGGLKRISMSRMGRINLK